jgi:hypothetical protein
MAADSDKGSNKSIGYPDSDGRCKPCAAVAS